LEPKLAPNLLGVSVAGIFASLEHALSRVRLVLHVGCVERIVLGREILGGVGIGHVALLPLSAYRKHGYRKRSPAITTL
jgi:hypothetical protein